MIWCKYPISFGESLIFIMYTPLLIGSLVLGILYKLFGLKGYLVLLCIVAVLLALIYANQNKILYIPRTSPQMKSYQTQHFLPLKILQDGDTLPSRAARPKTWK
jgi:hypothetical protein